MSGNIIEIFPEVARRHPRKPAIVQGERSVSYETMHADVGRVAGYLRERGIGHGSRVLIFVPMSIELYEILLGIFHLGAVAVFIDAWSDRKRLAAACRAASPDAFIGTTRAQLLRLLSPEIRAIPVKLRSNVGAWHPKNSQPPPVADVSPEEPALITFTTGSTGTPKGANRTHGFLLAQHRALVANLRPTPDDVDMPVLPIFVLSNLATGSTTVLPPVDPRHVEQFDPATVVEVMTQWKVTTTSGSPAFYEKLARYVQARAIPLPTLQRLFLGGAPIFPPLARLLVEAFPHTETTILYGSTEAEPISELSARELLRDENATVEHGLLVGHPVEQTDVALIPIVDAPIVLAPGETIGTIRLPPGEPGEICVAGDHVLREYHGDQEAMLRNKIRDGGRIWHRTGDAGYIDRDGRLFLLGRARQSFEHKGRRIFPFPIEARLHAMPEVATGTILKVGSKLVVVIELAKGERLNAGELEQMLAQGGIPFDAVRIIHAIPRDPRHHSKIDYDRLREMLA